MMTYWGACHPLSPSSCSVAQINLSVGMWPHKMWACICASFHAKSTLNPCVDDHVITQNVRQKIIYAFACFLRMCKSTQNPCVDHTKCAQKLIYAFAWFLRIRKSTQNPCVDHAKCAQPINLCVCVVFAHAQIHAKSLRGSRKMCANN